MKRTMLTYRTIDAFEKKFGVDLEDLKPEEIHNAELNAYAACMSGENEEEQLKLFIELMDKFVPNWPHCCC